jgi:hypothetical protein
MRAHKRQRKVQTLTRYVIKIDEEQAYVFTFKAGTLFNKIKREMRKVAQRFGYTPYELFTQLEFFELLTKPEIEAYYKEIRNEEIEAERSATGSETTSGSTGT